MDMCLKYHEKWSAGHRFSRGAIHNNLRNHLKSGEWAVHLVTYLSEALENENNYAASEEPNETH